MLLNILLKLGKFLSKFKDHKREFRATVESLFLTINNNFMFAYNQLYLNTSQRPQFYIETIKVIIFNVFQKRLKA